MVHMFGLDSIVIRTLVSRSFVVVFRDDLQKSEFTDAVIHASLVEGGESVDQSLPAVPGSLARKRSAAYLVSLLLEPPSLPRLNNRIGTPSITNDESERKAERNHKCQPGAELCQHRVHQPLPNPRSPSINSPFENPQHDRTLRHRANPPETNPLSDIHRRGDRARSPQERHRPFNARCQACGVPSRVRAVAWYNEKVGEGEGREERAEEEEAEWCW